MAISFVGYASTKSVLNGGTKSLSLTTLSSGSVQPDDVVVFTATVGSNANRSLAISTAGYTSVASLYANDTLDTMLAVGIKVMGSTPDTSADVTFSNASTSAIILEAHVYRGVDGTTPQDVAAVVATAINGAVPDPGAITPVTSGAKIVVIGANAHDRGVTTLSAGYLSNTFGEYGDGSSQDCTVLIGDVDWTGGSYNPAAFTWSGTDSATYSNATVVLALRPAATGISGDASGSFGATGASAGAVAVAGQASGSLDASGASTGAVSASGVNGAASGSLAMDGAATGAVSVSGAAAGVLGESGAAAGAVAIKAVASGSLAATGSAAGTVSAAAATAVSAGAFDLGGSATADAGLPPIQIIRGDDAPDWRKPFYDRQVKEFEDALREIVEASDPQDAAEEASEAFEPIETTSAAVRAASQTISEGLRHLRMHALRRKEVRDEVARIREELALIAEWRRKRRNNEAALMLLM